MTEKNAIKIRKQKQQKQIVQELQKIPVIQIVCERLGIGRQSYYRWRKENHSFANKCDQAIEQGCQLINDLAEGTIISAMKNQNLMAAFYWLNHRSPKYSNKLEINGSLNVKNQKLSKDEEKEIMKALELASLVTKSNNERNKNETKS